MSARRGSPRRGPIFVLLTLLLSAACTAADGRDVPSAEAAADRFLTAWTAGDTTAMATLLDDESAPEWPAEKLDRMLDKTFERGQIATFEAGRTEPVETPDADEAFDAEQAPEVDVPYSVTYTSPAVAGPVVLEGTLALGFEREEEGWFADFDRELLWPGIEGARSFRVTTEWPKRGRILDRDGRVLARGAPEERAYPFGALGGNTVGHLEPLARNDLATAGEGHKAGDLVGASGLEAAYEERLAGSPASRLDVVDERGRSLELVGEDEGVRGRDVRATLDMEIQRAAANAFGSTVGGTVVLQPATGDILAAVSAGEIDPNNYVGVPEISPFNRALSGLYPPGSAMKVVTAAAALDTGVVTPSTSLTGPKEYQGVRNFESESFATLSFASALQHSVNTAFAQVALDLGAQRLIRYAEAFGFNRSPEMPLEAATSSFPFPADPGDLMWGSIGQARDLATPMQMASVAATVANGGVRMEPRASLADPKERSRVMKRATARTLTTLMQNVVVGGTGTAANIAGANVAGKTGTAEVDVNGERRNHAWFIAFAPGGDPTLAVAVVSEYGGVGGQVAAPLARGILAGSLPLAE